MMSRHCPSTLPFRQIRPYQRRYAPADQRGLQHLLLLRRGRDQQPHLSLPFLHRHPNPLAEQNPVRRKRRHHPPRRDDPGKVERIGPAHRDELFRFPFPVSRFPPNGAQRPHRLRQRILLSGEPAHEPTAPDLAPGFEPPVHAQDVPPRREQALTLEQPAEHHPVAPQQLPRLRFGDLLLGDLRRTVHARPPPRRLHSERGHFAAPPVPRTPCSNRPAAPRRNQQRPQAREAVRRYQPPRHQLAESLLHLRAQQSSRIHEVAEERRPALVQHVEDRLPRMRQGGGRGAPPRPPPPPPPPPPAPPPPPPPHAPATSSHPPPPVP